MSGPVTPIFLFSLPRSGSTLLQRILASHPLICTASEPWLLLPMLYGLRSEGTYAEYNHHSVHNALSDFIKTLPAGRSDYLRQLNRFVTGLYQSASISGERYFLDKTPRYHLIVDEILETFPNARFIFLWRNPLAVIGSSLETFGNGKWRLYEYRIDFYRGLENLYTAYIQNRDKVHCINYERLITAPDEELRRLLDYLDLKGETPDINGFSKVKLSGGLGDPTGTKKYQSISTEPLHKWRSSLCNPIRRFWAKRYVEWIGQSRLADMGYDLHTLREELDDLPACYQRLYSDVIRITYGLVSTLLETRQLADKMKKLPHWIRIYPHR